MENVHTFSASVKDSKMNGEGEIINAEQFLTERGDAYGEDEDGRFYEWYGDCYVLNVGYFFEKKDGTKYLPDDTVFLSKVFKNLKDAKDAFDVVSKYQNDFGVVLEEFEMVQGPHDNNIESERNILYSSFVLGEKSAACIRMHDAFSSLILLDEKLAKSLWSQFEDSVMTEFDKFN